MEAKHTSKNESAQLGRIIAAAAHVSQARLLVLQERRETLSGRKAHLLGTIAESLEALVQWSVLGALCMTP
jgi:hypothetical protein